MRSAPLPNTLGLSGLRLIAGLAIAIALARPAAAQVPAPTFPLSLLGAVQHAIATYPAVQASAARVAAQDANVDLARTAYLPRVDTSLQINRATRNNVAGLLLPGAVIPPISGPVAEVSSSSSIWGSAGALVVSWEAFDFGQRGASVNAARTLVARANATAELTRLDVAVRTADAFLRLATAQETLKSAQAYVERQQVFATSVGALVRNELRPGADESRAQAELAAARIQLIHAQQAERVARAGLSQWLGVPPADIQISVDALLTMAPPPPAKDAAATTSHPLAQVQRSALESSRAIQDVLGKSYVPRVNFQTAYSLRDSGAAANAFNLGGRHGLGFDTPNWAIGVTATFPLLDYFSLRERTRIEEQNERAERATYDRVVRELSTQAEQAHAEVEGARQIALNTPLQLQAARVLEQQSRARYDAGLATIVEVADAQRLLMQSEVGDAVAKLAVWRALLSEVAAGGDLSRLLSTTP